MLVKTLVCTQQAQSLNGMSGKTNLYLRMEDMLFKMGMSSVDCLINADGSVLLVQGDLFLRNDYGVVRVCQPMVLKVVRSPGLSLVQVHTDQGPQGEPFMPTPANLVRRLEQIAQAQTEQ